MAVAWTLWLVLYFGFIRLAHNGLTPGKRLLGIQVTSLTHDRISLWQAIERALGYGASALEDGFGSLQYFTNRNHCCAPDRIAETIVIRSVPPETVQKMSNREGSCTPQVGFRYNLCRVPERWPSG